MIPKSEHVIRKQTLEEADVTDLIKYLENVRSGPGLWLSKELPLVVTFLTGFSAACRALGMKASPDATNGEILAERGWNWTPAGPWKDMEEKGLSEAEIVNELLLIEVEAIKRRYGAEAPLNAQPAPSQDE